MEQEFDVEIKEVLSRVQKVKAESLDDAINKAKYSSDRDTLRVECKSAVFHADFLLLRLSRFGNSTGSDASS